MGAGFVSLTLALAAQASDGTSNRIILATRDGALASALAVAVSPRGLSVMELSEPLAGVAAADTARREVVAHDAVGVVWLCDDDAGAHGLCFCARDGRLTRKPITMTAPLEAPDAAALALSVKLLLGPASAPAAPAPPPSAPPVTVRAEEPARVQPQAPRSSPRSALGLSLSLLPAGSLSFASTGGAQAGADAATAFAFAPFLDYSPLPQLSVGLSPQVIFNVKASGGSSAATEYDLRARVTYGLPLSGRWLIFARLSPGYSFVQRTGAETGTGFVLDAAAGVEFPLTDAAFLTADLGFQMGFQSVPSTRYPHVGLGLGFALGR